MIRGLDHVILVVPGLATAVAEHRERGFTVTPGGEHTGGLTHNALVGFQDGSYLELIAFHDLAAAREKHSWAPVAARGGGWADFALLSNDLRQDAAALGDLVIRPPEDGGRVRPDGLAIAWRVARLQPPLPFLIEDLTPQRDDRRRSHRPRGHRSCAHHRALRRAARARSAGPRSPRRRARQAARRPFPPAVSSRAA